MVRYMKVRWIHDHPGEPVLLYSEIDAGREVRKVEEYRDGHRDFADASTASGPTFLAEGLMPTVDDLRDDPEFEPELISRTDFEQIWASAVGR